MKHNNPVSVCIIDQDELVTMALKHEIEKAFAVHTVSIFVFSSAAQYKALMKSSPDIAILDYRLNTQIKKAGRDLTFIDRLKAGGQTQVIILTPEESAEIAVQSLHHGVHDYIVKNEFMFKKLRLSLIQCLTILELRRNMKKQVGLGIVAIILVFIMFGVALGLRTLAPVSLMIR